jgi:hypothetical protein
MKYPDELPELREITEEDWGLIEYLVQRSFDRGDVYTNGQITAERARQLLEMPEESIFTVVMHLALLRRDPFVSALETMDSIEGGSICAEVLEIQQDRDKRWEAMQAGPRQRKPRTPKPVDPVEALAAEALALEPDSPTTMASIAAWEATGREGDWRQTFRLDSDFLQGRQALVLIAGATGAAVAEVEAHSRELAQRYVDQAAEVAAAWSDAEQLLADAVTAGSWEGLAVAAGVTPDVLQRRFRQLRDRADQSSGSGASPAAARASSSR